MPRPVVTPRPGEAQSCYLNLRHDVALDLHVFIEVTDGQKTRIINRAVRELIDRELSENPGVRHRYQMLKATMANRVQSEGNAIRLIKGSPRDRRERSKSRRKPQSDGVK